MQTAVRILVVHPESSILWRLAKLLGDAGYRATGVPTFDQAKHVMPLVRPHLLISAIRLGSFNGLHLVVRTRADHPQIGAILLGPVDPVLQAEAARLEADYLLEVIPDAEMLEAVSRALGKAKVRRQWPRHRPPQGLPARIEALCATIVELSYGGLRLAFAKQPAEDLPSTLDVRLLDEDVSVTAERVWIEDDPASGAVVCGAAILPGDTPSTPRWRQLVDRFAKATEADERPSDTIH